jgi:hypothetical protein
VFPKKLKSEWFTCSILNSGCVMPGMGFKYSDNSFSGLYMTASYVLYCLLLFIQETGEKMFMWCTATRI